MNLMKHQESSILVIKSNKLIQVVRHIWLTKYFLTKPHLVQDKNFQIGEFLRKVDNNFQMLEEKYL